jgi:hypothetical protein
MLSSFIVVKVITVRKFSLIGLENVLVMSFAPLETVVRIWILKSVVKLREKEEVLLF